jgi:hypothetical protein
MGHFNFNFVSLFLSFSLIESSLFRPILEWSLERQQKVREWIGIQQRSEMIAFQEK